MTPSKHTPDPPTNGVLVTSFLFAELKIWVLEYLYIIVGQSEEIVLVLLINGDPGDKPIGTGGAAGD